MFFFKGRKLIKTIPTNVDANKVREYSYNMAHRIWDPLSYNCEHYVNELVYSEQKSKFSTGLKIAFLLALFIK